VDRLHAILTLEKDEVDAQALLAERQRSHQLLALSGSTGRILRAAGEYSPDYRTGRLLGREGDGRARDMGTRHAHLLQGASYHNLGNIGGADVRMRMRVVDSSDEEGDADIESEGDASRAHIATEPPMRLLRVHQASGPHHVVRIHQGSVESAGGVMHRVTRVAGTDDTSAGDSQYRVIANPQYSRHAAAMRDREAERLILAANERPTHLSSRDIPTQLSTSTLPTRTTYILRTVGSSSSLSGTPSYVAVPQESTFFSRSQQGGGMDR
jgi:hypothetical protein